MPFQKQVVAAEVIVMPRSCSCSIQSMRRGAVVHFADLVVDAGVEQDALGGRGLAGVDVRRDTDVPVALDGGLAGHDKLQMRRASTGPLRGAAARGRAVERGSGLWYSEAEVREGLVGLGHAVHFVALLHRAAAAFDGLEQLVREALRPSTSRRACGPIP